MTSRIMTEQMKSLLRLRGNTEREIEQIGRAMWSRYTTYEYVSKNGKISKISRDEAIKKLGLESYLAGMDRSAFHGSATVRLEDGGKVYFDTDFY